MRWLFLGKLWRGDYGLARTFWLWGFVYPLALLLGLMLLGLMSEGRFELAQYIALLAMLGYWAMWHVGLWRAAFMYEGLKLWPILACLVSIVSLANLVVATMGIVLGASAG